MARAKARRTSQPVKAGTNMKRIGILTAGGDTPALNASLHGAVVRANQRRVEVYGFIKGFNSLFNPRVPHVHLNPLFTTIPELDPTRGRKRSYAFSGTAPGKSGPCGAVHKLSPNRFGDLPWLLPTRWALLTPTCWSANTIALIGSSSKRI